MSNEMSPASADANAWSLERQASACFKLNYSSQSIERHECVQKLYDTAKPMMPTGESIQNIGKALERISDQAWKELQVMPQFIFESDHSANLTAIIFNQDPSSYKPENQIKLEVR